MIKRETIDRHLLDLAEKVRFLRTYKKYSLKDFEENLTIQFSAERAMQVAIQNVIDIGSHLLAAKLVNFVEDYKDVIVKLGQEEIIPKKFADSIKKMASFRNILVHNYIDVDLIKLYDLIQNNLDDFETFSNCVTKYLKNNLKL
ncbi:MAG: DUF86 domain-containing protein [bacterium]